MKYQRFTPSWLKDRGIRKFKFMTKTQFLTIGMERRRWFGRVEAATPPSLIYCLRRGLGWRRRVCTPGHRSQKLQRKYSFLQIKNNIKIRYCEVFATISNFSIPTSLQPDGLNIWYIKLRLFDQTEFIVWINKRFTTFGCKDMQIRKSEFVAKKGSIPSD